MLKNRASTATHPARTSGFLYQGKDAVSITGPVPQTSPFSSSIGLGLVTNESKMVETKQTTQEVLARQKLAAIGEEK